MKGLFVALAQCLEPHKTNRFFANNSAQELWRIAVTDLLWVPRGHVATITLSTPPTASETLQLYIADSHSHKRCASDTTNMAASNIVTAIRRYFYDRALPRRCRLPAVASST